MSHIFNKKWAKGRQNKGQQFIGQWLLLMKHIFSNSERQTGTAPHIRSLISVQTLLNRLVIASIPCWLIGLWNLGYQINLALMNLSLTTLPSWQGSLLSLLGVGHNNSQVLGCLLLGLLYFLPVFLVAFFTASIWEVIFAKVRRLPFSEGVLVFAWMFSLLMPAGIDLYKVFIGVTFGYVMGSAIFGGYGRYLVSPILLGVVFLLFSYPELVRNPEVWVPVPGAEVMLPLNLVATGGVNAIHSAGFTWWDLFLGKQSGPIGSVSVLGCLLGAIYLILTDSAAWRIMLGALIGMVLAVLIYAELAYDSNPMASISACWHLVLGAFTFGVVFFATDSVSSTATPGGRWVYGLLVGVLATIIRISNPSYNEGVLFAVLLASLFAPIIDFCFIELNIRRRRIRNNKK